MPMSSAQTPSSHRIARSVGFWTIAIVLIALCLYSRRPDAIRRPQFYAEDGTIFYQQAYQNGAVVSLFHPYNGYFHVMPRIAAAISLLFPFSSAPIFLALIALAVQAAPAIFLLSDRMRNLGSLGLRCGLAALYLAIPGIEEIHVTITGVQWHLAVIAFLVVIAESPGSPAGQIFDIVLLTLAVTSGPFSIFLLLPALLVLAVRRDKWSVVRLSMCAGGVVLAFVGLLLTAHSRPQQPLGASVAGFSRIVAGQVVLRLVQGHNRLDHLSPSPAVVTALSVVITLLTLAVVLYGLRRGTLELRALLLYGSLLLAAALAFPTASTTTYQWIPMQVPGAASRYWYIPDFALIATLIWMLGAQRPALIRVIATTLICMTLYGMMKYWRFPAAADLHFPTYARQFENLAPRERLQIPVNPPGWSMTLIKK
jgi:hypothetical protein